MATVLIVDDSGFSRSRVAAALEPLGHRLIEAGDGRSGLDAVDQHSPDLIITDLLMPRMDGFGLMRGLQDRGLQVPVMVLTADIQVTSRQICEKLGACAVVNKPFQAKELASRVQDVLQMTAAIG
jgi:CheY-like chemotaxis protein